jgi:hypothetical protein
MSSTAIRAAILSSFSGPISSWSRASMSRSPALREAARPR